MHGGDTGIPSGWDPRPGSGGSGARPGTGAEGGDVRLQPLCEPLHILLTNDDGIHSPGLLSLKRSLEALEGVTVTVVAPDRNRTGAARSITMRSPLWVEEVELPDGSTVYATDGTPVDCVRMAALGFVEPLPGLIVSGINLGGNLGDDVTYSGTVAAAFEGIMLDIPAVALSAEGYEEGFDFGAAAEFSARLVSRMRAEGFPPKTCLNVNFPAPGPGYEEARLTVLGKRIYGDKVQLQEQDGRRRRYLIYGDDLRYHIEPGTDFEAVAAGAVSITPIHFDLTARRTMEALRPWLQGLNGTPDSGTGIEAGAGAGAEVESGETDLLEPGPAGGKDVRGVIFDLDGTLVDSVEHILASFRHATREVLGRELDDEELMMHVGRPLRRQMELIDGERAEELVRVFREFNHREHDRMVRLYPGAADLLGALRVRGLKVGLATSKSRSTTEMAFRLTGIERYFDAVVCADDTEHNKPHPEPLLRCAEFMGVSPAQAVYVGDSPYDMEAGRAAGMRTVAVAWGAFSEDRLVGNGADVLVRTQTELRNVLGM